MPVSMPCKIPIKSSGETHHNVGKHMTKYVCVVDADESTRPRLDGAGQKPHQGYLLAVKGKNSMIHKIPDAKASVEKEMGKLEKIPAWDLTKVRHKQEVIEEARNKGRKVPFASWISVILRNRSWSFNTR